MELRIKIAVTEGSRQLGGRLISVYCFCFIVFCIPFIVKTFLAEGGVVTRQQRHARLIFTGEWVVLE